LGTEGVEPLIRKARAAEKGRDRESHPERGARGNMILLGWARGAESEGAERINLCSSISATGRGDTIGPLRGLEGAARRGDRGTLRLGKGEQNHIYTSHKKESSGKKR